jgi:hypothetical protein
MERDSNGKGYSISVGVQSAEFKQQTWLLNYAKTNSKTADLSKQVLYFVCMKCNIIERQNF